MLGGRTLLPSFVLSPSLAGPPRPLRGGPRPTLRTVGRSERAPARSSTLRGVGGSPFVGPPTHPLRVGILTENSRLLVT